MIKLLLIDDDKELAELLSEFLTLEDFDVDIITRFHVTTINNLHNSGLFSKAEIHNYKIYKEYFLLFMRGVASAKGLEILEERIKEYDLINR